MVIEVDTEEVTAAGVIASDQPLSVPTTPVAVSVIWRVQVPLTLWPSNWASLLGSVGLNVPDRGACRQ